MYLSQRYSLEDFNEVLDKNNPEVFKIKNIYLYYILLINTLI